jgi:hypothetical protein
MNYCCTIFGLEEHFNLKATPLWFVSRFLCHYVYSSFANLNAFKGNRLIAVLYCYE